MAPSLGGTLKILEPLSQRQIFGQNKRADNSKRRSYYNYLRDWKSHFDDVIKSESEAKETLENLRSTINEAIEKGVAPAPREKVRVEPMEIYKYLPQTNCGKCGEQSCYTFAIKRS